MWCAIRPNMRLLIDSSALWKYDVPDIIPGGIVHNEVPPLTCAPRPVQGTYRTGESFSAYLHAADANAAMQ